METCERITVQCSRAELCVTSAVVIKVQISSSGRIRGPVALKGIALERCMRGVRVLWFQRWRQPTAHSAARGTRVVCTRTCSTACPPARVVHSRRVVAVPVKARNKIRPADRVWIPSTRGRRGWVPRGGLRIATTFLGSVGRKGAACEIGPDAVHTHAASSATGGVAFKAHLSHAEISTE